MYRSVPPKIDLPSMEREIIDFWAAHDVFHRSLQQTEGGPQWTFYEGPPPPTGRRECTTSRPGSSRTYIPATAP